jgi:type II secretory pathway component HofQ
MTTATVVPIRREFQVHRFDPIKHGVLSRHIALPWEDREAFEEILRGLLVEHQPQGPTAYHLVEDLAGVIWRKRRLLQAEGAAIRERLHKVATGYQHEQVARYALAHKDEKIHAEVRDVIAHRLPKPEDAKRDLEMIERALATVSKGKRGAYQAALRLLDEDTLAAWDAEAVDEAEPDAGGYTRDADGLKESLEATRNWLESCIADAANAADVTEQAHGMAIDIRDLERIARIEAHLDAKLQRLLTLLRQSRKARPAIKG